MIGSLNVLVLGLGNIGALYDLETTDIKTHVKAWSLVPNVNLSIFDVDKALMKKIALRYNCRTLETVNVEILAGFDCVCICTPTTSHKELLLSAFNAGIKVILCEKPISYDLGHVIEIEEAYHAGSSKVLVNYIRRFQPAYSKLQSYISMVEQNAETLKAVNVKYHRGFINNCSHAFDLIEYLFKQELIIEDIYKCNPVFDHFDSDPTLSLWGKWRNATISVLGLHEVLFSIFEIELYFETQKVLIINAGDRIEFYSSLQNSGKLSPLFKTEEFLGCITDYMKPVIEKALDILVGKCEEDNFISSIKLNTRMLNYLND